ncbi:MAG: prolyl oligopeptidase family serine peptidase [Acidimicrobiales bacterium]|nr:prolyl oligopeptidase family serine peptidase [Acidimicrobiales bacterium]
MPRETCGHRVTAGDLWWHASLSWQYAQFMWFHDPDQRRYGQQRKVAAYRRAAPNLVPEAHPADVPFGNDALPAWLRRPRHVTGTVPVVILIGGLESTKEESLRFENLLLERGMATLAFDGPGQGEFAAVQPLDDRFDRATSAVVDALLERDDIDPARIAVLGRSLGGFLAPLSAARDERLCAAAAFGALFDLRFFDDIPPVPASGFRQLTGIDADDAAEQEVRRIIDLSGDIASLRCPLYVQHGEQDALIPVEQAHLTAAQAVNADVTLAIDPDGDHCSHNRHHIVRPQLADWLADQLESQLIVDTLKYRPPAGRRCGRRHTPWAPALPHTGRALVRLASRGR